MRRCDEYQNFASSHSDHAGTCSGRGKDGKRKTQEGKKEHEEERERPLISRTSASESNPDLVTSARASESTFPQYRYAFTAYSWLTEGRERGAFYFSIAIVCTRARLYYFLQISIGALSRGRPFEPIYVYERNPERAAYISGMGTRARHGDEALNIITWSISRVLAAM